MSSSDFMPAVTYMNIYTEKDSKELILHPEKDNHLYISCRISGLTQRTLEFIHEKLDYIAIHFTLLHQFGGKETTIVRRYMVEYDPEQGDIDDDNDLIELKIPIDDDFSGIDFVLNYYFLQMGFTSKHPGVMGISESLHIGKFFETKIPFINAAEGGIINSDK